MGGNEEGKRASICEKADLVDRRDDAIDLQEDMRTNARKLHQQQLLTVSPLKGLQTTARYPTVNSAKPLPGKMRPSERVKVSMMVTM